jgi:starch-binding outer membrane protein, SusD/RagB family
MVMKKIFFDTNKIIVGFVLIAGSFTSCKKLIEIPANPPSLITQQEQFADSATTITAVAGVYTYNNGNGFAYADGSLTFNSGLSADELSTVTSTDEQEFYSYTLTPVNAPIATMWGNPYQSIYQVNAVMAGVTNNAGLSAGFQKQVTGEMDVVRALYYFNLANVFGGVPLVTTTAYAATARLPRSTVAAIYTQVKTDLADAQKKLTANYPSAGHLRPNLYTAVALLAKVNLYQGNWQNAYNEADSVIRLGGYNLEPNLNNVFLDGSQEAIWQLPANGLYGVYTDAAYFQPQYFGNIPYYVVTPFLLNAFESTDQRLQTWIASESVNNQTIYYANKYRNVSPTATPAEDQMILRLGELYLIRAEAAAQLNKLPEATADINTIRARAGLPATTATTQTAILSAVMHERQVELCCEWGNRWFDLKRTGTAAAVLGAEKTGFTANAELYPIPQTQIQLDNVLIQNPGY